MPDPSLSILASLLRPVAQAAFKHASRLHAERTAGQSSARSGLIESNLNETLDRLRGERIDDSWWRNVLKKIGQEYIAPNFLRKPALQEWLADDRVAGDLKALAKEIVMGGTGSDPESRARLVKSYSDRTGEASRLADGSIDGALTILVAGCIASIPSDQRPIAGMFQELYVHFNKRFDHLEENRLSDLEESVTQQFPIIQQFLTNHAEQELFKILSLRAFDPNRSRRQIRELLKRAIDGDLAAASNPTKNRLRYWTARLCVSETETLPLTKQLRNELREADLDMDLSIVDALIAETDGDADKALRLLRDPDNADSRSAWFGLLSRLKDKPAAMAWFEQQDGRDDLQFFTPVGWVNWAICASEVGKWEETSERLVTLEDRWDEMPTLAVVEGCINAAMLLPSDFRKMVLDGIPFYQGITPNQRATAENHHSRATDCFNFVGRKLQDIADQSWTNFVADWSLWLRLMNPRTEGNDIAGDEIKRRMDQGGQAVEAMPFAYTFEIGFDPEPLTRYLEQRKALGGLDDHELRAECLLSAQFMSPRDLADYLEQNKTRLTEVVPLQLLTAMHVNALIGDNQPEKVQEVVEGYGTLDEDHSDRLIILIGAHGGRDPRNQLEDRYHRTESLVDLRNLISHLKMAGDCAALRPLIHQQFGLAPTVENALDVVRCLSDPTYFDHESIIDFLEDNSDILEQSDDLKTAKASALFHAGRLEDSRKINDILLSRKTNRDNLRLDLKIAMASGAWERIGGILDRAWDQRDSYDPEALITFAHLAGQQDQMHDRALQLARRAVDKAPDDPRILAAAYWQHFQLGRDDEADPAWLMHATELSSTEEGPIWRVNLRDVATDWLPKRRDHLREVERKWLDGEIPMSIAAGSFNVSLARLLLHIPDQSANEPDGRRRVILPIIAGARNPIELQEIWTVGLDLTSVMVLSYLGLLQKAIDAFRHIKLAPDIMEHLFQERDDVLFHQPSRVKAANQVLELQGRGQLEVANKPVTPPKAMVDEAGHELAALLQMARDDNSKVICVLPILKAGSLMEQQADTDTFDDLIISILDFCTLLRDRGKIDAANYQRAWSFLNNQGQSERDNIPPSILDSPVYMDGLALRYLLDANVLQPVAAAGVIIRIHPDILHEMRALTEEGDAGQGLIDSIEGIRHILRTTIDKGNASFLPRAADQNEQNQSRKIRFQATASLLEGSAAYDVLCIDDRYINNHTALNGPTGRTIPIACVLDVLRHLVSQGSIGISENLTARHKLRQGGFAFIPLEAEELVHWLKEARVDEGELVESMELRVLRQTTARADSLDLTNWEEAFALTSKSRASCSQSIFDLWEDLDMPPEDATRLSDWVWRNLMATAIPGRRILAHGAYTNLIREMVSLRLGSLLLPMPTRPQERHDHYADWLEQSLLQPLWPANTDRIVSALSNAHDAISDLEIDQAAYGNLFLEKLPEPARRMMINGDPEFARKCGFQAKRVFSIGTHIKLTDTDLFAAASEVFATIREKSIQDITGNEVLVGLDTENGNIVVKWSDTENVTQQVPIPLLSLLSPNLEARLPILNNVIDDFGPTATDLRHLLEDIQSRELSYQELSTIFDESVNGVAAVQARQIHKIQQRLPAGVSDFVPQSLAYFERLSGPNPEAQEPELYFLDVLVPYRKVLLNRNLGAGLDICCLGALRDDLSPGQWVVDIDNDAIWNALPSCHAKSNPFSLLGALDIALYRQGDERFREFAAEAVTQLSDENFSRRDGHDIYRLLQVFADFVLNRINLLENGAHYPGYWKRMSAWMHAGLIARAMAESSFLADITALQEWTHDNMFTAGVYAGLINSMKEPMLFADRMTPQFLRAEILGRLQILKSRHEREGRQVPNSTNVVHALERDGAHGLALAGLPGPLEGHRRPTEPISQETRSILEEIWAESSEPLQSLVSASQFFALGPPELERARTTVRTFAENIHDSDPQTILMQMELASIVAAANRNPELADGIADVVIGISPRAFEEEEVQMILRIMLQAAAAHETRDAWFKWLEERLANIATHLPPPPNKSLQIFLGHLGDIEVVLPAESWFHIRARSMALAGAA